LGASVQNGFEAEGHEILPDLIVAGKCPVSSSRLA